MSFDYASEYDGYWSSEDRAGEQSFADADALAEEILLSCGGRKILDIGSGMGHLVRALLRVGIDATGVDVSSVAAAHANQFAPDRFKCASVLELPFEAETFDTVVSTDCLEHLAEDDVVKALREIRRVVRRSLFFRIATTQDRDGHWHLTVQSRAWWERRFFEAGFRKHPSYYQINKYEALENDGWQITLLFEKMPEPAFTAYPLEILAEERDLHMDMLRETGSRSDAHVGRYQWANQYIRPGDTILDAACGLGYGSHVLQSSSTAARTIGIDGSEYAVDYARLNFSAINPKLEFRCGFLPEALAGIADQSIDIIVSFETLEHVQDNTALLAEFHRILTPGGRLLVSVPNDWSDDTGEDPNPYHLHVYTLPRLRSELSSHFTLEALMAQTANQCKSGPDRKTWRSAGRSMQPFSPHAPADAQGPEAEWWLAVAMRSPLGSNNAAYRETTYPSFEHPAWNITRFSAQYRNPWLVRSMVDTGHRMSDPMALRELASTVYTTSDNDSADQGAALCVLAYQLLADRQAGAMQIAEIAARIRTYTERAGNMPHAVRWRVSLLFVLGKLWMEAGDFQSATTALLDCVAIEANAFSPLLCNRTVEARLLLGVLAISADDRAAARNHWQAGITTARQAVTADWHTALGDIGNPAEFGLPELASILEYASACAYALANIEDIDTKYWWWLHLHRDRLSRTRLIARQLAEVRTHAAALTSTQQEKQRELDTQGEHISTFLADIAGKQRELDMQGEHISAFLADIAGKQRELDLQGRDISTLQQQVARLQVALNLTDAELNLERERTELLNDRLALAEDFFKWAPEWLRKQLKFL